MPVKTIIVAATLAAIALPIAVLAIEPRLPERPSLDSAKVLSLLVLDPYEETQLQVNLPTGFATLDVDADPFKAL